VATSKAAPTIPVALSRFPSTSVARTAAVSGSMSVSKAAVLAEAFRRPRKYSV
jgi:hypothetical protein